MQDCHYRRQVVAEVFKDSFQGFRWACWTAYGYYSGGYALKEDAKDKFFIYEKGQRVSTIKP